MALTDFLQAELLVLVPVLYFIGKTLRFSGVSEKKIPLLLCLVGTLLSSLDIFSICASKNVEIILMALYATLTQGILVAGISVYMDLIPFKIFKDQIQPGSTGKMNNNDLE